MLRGAYRLALRLYPRRVRERDGSEMLGLFDDMVDGARRSGGRRAAAETALRILAEVPVSAVRARAASIRAVVDGVRIDLRVASRGVRRRPHFAAAALLTLAVGIGGTTSVFGVLHGTLQRPPPFPDADRLAVLHLAVREPGGATRAVRWSWPELRDFAAASDFAEGLASFARAGFNVGGADGAVPNVDPRPAEHVPGETVSGGYFAVLGVDASLGRALGPRDDALRGASPVVVLGHDLWQRRYGADPAVVGRTTRVNRVPLTVVGVMPAGFSGLSGRAELWIPHAVAPRVYYDAMHTGHQHFLTAVARLRPGVGVATARARTAALAAAVADEAGHDGDGVWSGTLTPLGRARIDPDDRRAQLLLFGAVTLVLLVGCANLANILLARTMARRRELATRVSLGSTPGRLLRQLAVEGMALALLGGVLAVGVAWLGTDLLAGLLPEVRPAAANHYAQLGQLADVRVDVTVLLFAGMVTLLVGLALGLLPAAWATRADPGTALRDRFAGSSGAGSTPTRSRASGWTPAGAIVARPRSP